MIMSLLKALVEFTPTQKDDELIAQLESFLENNPELAAMVLKLALSMMRSKS